MDILNKFLNIQKKMEERSKRIGKGKYGRVLKMAVKPDTEEYSKIIQITGMGIILIGLLGFTIYYIWSFSGPWFLRVMGY